MSKQQKDASLLEAELPPPKRPPERKLSLASAMASVRLSEPRKAAALEKRDSFISKQPISREAEQLDQETHLIELKADIFNEQELLKERQRTQHARELALNEREALMEARRKVLEAQIRAPEPGENEQADASSDAMKAMKAEREALEELKRELNAQEASLKESQKGLRSRELFIDLCENELIAKSTQLSEREARIEQMEEDSLYQQSRDTAAAPVSKAAAPENGAATSSDALEKSPPRNQPDA